MSWIVMLIVAAIGITAAVIDIRKTGGSRHPGGHYSRYHSCGSGNSQRTGTLIEHPHYTDSTDYECSVCGKRFDDDSKSCPYCGTVFTDTETDTWEYDEEEDEEMDMDEEDGW